MRIACIHQGYELYGSDRCFVESVAALRKAFPQARIEVVLPRHGPIVAPLAALADAIVFEPLFVLRRRSLLKLMLLAAVAFPLALARAFRRFATADLVYINTSVILDYQTVARFFRAKSLLHIHEIPTGAARKILRAFALWSGAELIFNSNATRDAFVPPPGRRYHVVYNGLPAPARVEPMSYDGMRPLRVLMLGRINRIKGQDVLLAAVVSLPQALRDRLTIRMVGGAFEDPDREARLADDIRDQGLEQCVAIEPFATDTAPLYHWADVVVVPSKEPESLGRVAIEAMAYERPPIASAIGGLREVVADGVTGWLTPPGDAAALADRLRATIEWPEAWRAFGAAGRARFEALFSADSAAAALAAIAAKKLERRSRPSAVSAHAALEKRS
jgi:glycosyltransferase involved in cell wall biosynthesis